MLVRESGTIRRCLANFEHKYTLTELRLPYSRRFSFISFSVADNDSSGKTERKRERENSYLCVCVTLPHTLGLYLLSIFIYHAIQKPAKIMTAPLMWHARSVVGYSDFKDGKRTSWQGSAAHKQTISRIESLGSKPKSVYKNMKKPFSVLTEPTAQITFNNMLRP